MTFCSKTSVDAAQEALHDKTILPNVSSYLKPGSQYDAGAYVVSVASNLVDNMTLKLTLCQ